jgi:hypothetical protein
MNDANRTPPVTSALPTSPSTCVHLFLSYKMKGEMDDSGDDEAAADRISRCLGSSGYTVYCAPQILGGAHWKDVVLDSIRACDGMVIVHSGHSPPSKWCFAEWMIGESLGKRLFPVQVDDQDLDPVLSHIQAVRYSGDPGALLKALASAWPKGGPEPTIEQLILRRALPEKHVSRELMALLKSEFDEYGAGLLNEFVGELCDAGGAELTLSPQFHEDLAKLVGSKWEQVPSGLRLAAKRVLFKLTRFDGKTFVNRRLPADELDGGIEEKALHELEASFLVARRGANVSVAHTAVLNAIPKVREFLESNQRGFSARGGW